MARFKSLKEKGQLNDIPNTKRTLFGWNFRNMNNLDQNLPHFICIGSQRAGTTWLHNCLDEHPEVFVPPAKELHFFDRFYDTGLDNYKANFSTDKVKGKKTWGELTPNYYQEPGALERIKHDVPEVKIIYILREPVARAFSQYQLYAQGQFAGMTFENVIVKKPVVVDLSMQGKHLQRVYSLFDPSQVLVLFYDELTEQPQTLLKKVYHFIGVNDQFVPESLSKRINRIVLPDLQEKLIKWKLTWLINIVKASPFSEWVKEVAHRKTDKFGNTEHPLGLADIFSEDITIIENTQRVDLNHWR